MNFEKYTDSELWEILQGISQIIQAYPQDRDGNVFVFWYNMFKSAEKEIDKRLLAEY